MRQIVRRYWKSTLAIGFLFAVFFAVQAGRITRDGQVSKRPVQILDPVEYVRGFLCLPFETLGICDTRVPK